MNPATLSPCTATACASDLLGIRRHVRTYREHNLDHSGGHAMFFAFPEDARWNPDLDAVEFSVILDPYEGTVRIPRRVFQGLLDQSPTPALREISDLARNLRILIEND